MTSWFSKGEMKVIDEGIDPRYRSHGYYDPLLRTQAYDPPNTLFPDPDLMKFMRWLPRYNRYGNVYIKWVVDQLKESKT